LLTKFLYKFPTFYQQTFYNTVSVCDADFDMYEQHWLALFNSVCWILFLGR